MKYDIFISYRRDGGYDTAKHLYDLLVHDSYSVSFDIDTLRNGNFDTQLLERIENCKDFILILSKNVFERTLDPECKRENDWVRCEIAHALKHNVNIIPIFLEGFEEFPQNLPDDIAGVAKKNGIRYNREYFDAFYQNIKDRFLVSEALKEGKRKRVPHYCIAVCALLAILISVFAVNILNDKKMERDFHSYCSGADSLVNASYRLLENSSTLGRETVQKLESALEMYERGLANQIPDTVLYNTKLMNKQITASVLDSCAKYNDLELKYFAYQSEKSFVAAAESRAQQRIALDNIREKLEMICVQEN